MRHIFFLLTVSVCAYPYLVFASFFFNFTIFSQWCEGYVHCEKGAGVGNGHQPGRQKNGGRLRNGNEPVMPSTADRIRSVGDRTDQRFVTFHGSWSPGPGCLSSHSDSQVGNTGQAWEQALLVASWTPKMGRGGGGRKGTSLKDNRSIERGGASGPLVWNAGMDGPVVTFVVLVVKQNVNTRYLLDIVPHTVSLRWFLMPFGTRIHPTTNNDRYYDCRGSLSERMVRLVTREVHSDREKHEGAMTPSWKRIPILTRLQNQIPPPSHPPSLPEWDGRESNFLRKPPPPTLGWMGEE